MRITPRHRRAAVIVTGGLLVLSLVLLAGVRSGRPPAREVALSEFLTAIDAGTLRQVEIEPDRFVGVKADGSRVQTAAPLGYAAAHQTFVPDLIARGIRVEVKAGSAGAMFSASALRGDARAFSACSALPSTVSARAACPRWSRTPDRRSRTAPRSPLRMWPAWTRPRTNSRKSSSSFASPGALAPSAAAFPRACCWWALRERARRCWRARLPARPACRFSLPADRTSSRCLPASAPAASASCSRKRASTRPASSSSTSSTPWAAAAAASRSATKSASRP